MCLCFMTGVNQLYLSLFIECDGQLDLVFVLDASGSIRQERWPLIQSFVKNIVKQLEVKADRVQVGVITFSDSPRTDFSLNTYQRKEDVLHAIERIQYMRGKTHTASALQMMKNQAFSLANGDRTDVPNIAIIVTDGHSNINAEQTIPEAIQARVDGTHMIVATVENDHNNLELKGLASDPKEKNIFNVQRYSQLPTIVSTIVQATCNGKCRVKKIKIW